MTFNPQPKPQKQEKEKMTAAEFRKKYGKRAFSKNGKLRVKTNHRSISKKKKRIYSYPAWKWFARYIKLLRCEPITGLVKCPTSGRLFHVSSPSLHAGHCIKVYDGNNTNLSVAFDERNVFAQSGQDNVYSGGKPEVMRDVIDQTYGSGTYEELKHKAKSPKYYNTGDLYVKSQKYRKLTYELLEQKQIKKWW